MMSRTLAPLLAVLLAGSAFAADWKPAPAPLMTKWGRQITADKTPWAEYPRPQLVRKEWANLNGLWDYAIRPKGEKQPEKWDGKILVPFAVESALSGVGKHPTEKEELWYRRDVDASAWKGQRVRLNFEAVDWETTVWVNGKEVGTHKGMHDPFSFDITDSLKDGKGELVVRVWDPTDKGSQPLGKQISNPHGIWYTPVTGIWQTVWMEPVDKTHITSIRITPDLKTGKAEVMVEVSGQCESVEVTAVVADDKGIPTAPLRLGKDKPGKPLSIVVGNDKLWTPDTPHLHRIKVYATTKVNGEEQVADGVETYFAFRTVGVGKDADGVQRLLLNGKPLFQYGPLDQGWWPDGLLTPPSDEAMKYDLEVLKKVGFNMLRKHIKVEPSRYYYHCDKMGLLVWQDMPSAINRTKKHFIPPGGKTDADDQFTADEKKQFRGELKAMIDHLRGFGCIYCWVPFNEGWGQHDVNGTLKWVKEYDPTRPVNGPSGWEDRGYGDMKDAHIYPGPGMFPVMKDRVSVLGEFGGLGLPVKNHLWKDTGNWGYRTYKTEEELRTNYHALMKRMHPLIGKGLAAAVYTQTTDVEIEVNGLMTYDREVLKFDAGEMKKWHQMLFTPPPVVTEVVPTSETTAQTWKYTTDKPAEGWMKADFDAKEWKEGKGGFGTKMTPGSRVGTEWAGKEVWLRRTFELKELPTGEAFLRFHCDEDGEVFINGVSAAKLPGYTTEYVDVPISEAARKALKAGTNTFAVYAKNAGGGQYIDVGLVQVLPALRGVAVRSLSLLLLLAVPAPAADLLVGAAQVDITPEKGTPMAGYYSLRAAEGTHDPLFARALVIEQDGTKAVLVALDLIHTTFGMTAESRKLIEAETKIPGPNVMLFASHAHTGPTLAEGGTYAAATGGGNKLAKDYMAGLPKKIAAAVAKADAAKKPAKAVRGIGKEEGLAFNRRFHMTDGTVGWNPGKLNPKILKPAGPVDSAVSVVQFVTADKDAKVIATYVNFSMHADTVGGLHFSADYMGVIAEALAKVHGEQAVTIFGLGCCGDVNHINVNSGKPQKGHAEAARIGGRLAGEVLRVLDNAQPAEYGPLVVSTATVELELPKVSDDELDFAKGVVKEVLAETKPAPKFLDQVQAFKAVDVRQRLGKPIPSEVQVISLGSELAWVSLPGEIFTDLGLQIKDGSPFKQTMINELANGSVGYVPTKLAYSQGNYEVISARVAEGSGEKLVAEAAKQLRARNKK